MTVEVHVGDKGPYVFLLDFTDPGDGILDLNLARRMKMLSNASLGFVYAVTITGITGGDTGLPDGLAEYLDKVSASSQLPVCAGFGIRAATDVQNVGQHVAGAIVGSALVEVLENGEDPRTFLNSLGGR